MREERHEASERGYIYVLIIHVSIGEKIGFSSWPFDCVVIYSIFMCFLFYLIVIRAAVTGDVIAVAIANAYINIYVICTRDYDLKSFLR